MRELIRAVFVLALLANVILFAFGQTWLGIPPPAQAGRDPDRLTQQVRPDAIEIGPMPGVTPPPAPVSSVAPPVVAPAAAPEPVEPTPPVAAVPAVATTAALPVVPEPVVGSCMEWGGFTDTELAQALGWLAGRFPQLTVSTRRSEEPQTWMVRIPPQRTAAAAQARAAALRQQGVEDIYIFQDAGPNQHALSLGVFRNEEGARRFLESLQARRVTGAEVSTRSVTRTWLSLRPVSAETRQGLETSRATFPNHALRACTI